MPRISGFEILQPNEQPTLSIRTTTNVEKLPQQIGESYGKMAAYLKDLDEFLTDVPYVAYHNMDMQHLDVEIGFPVSKSLPAHDDIKSGSIPQGKVVFCMYRGAYSEIEPTYVEMSQWIVANGFQSTGTAYEYYYNGPDFPEADLLTKIVMPIV